MKLVSNFKKDYNNDFNGTVFQYIAIEDILAGHPVCWCIDISQNNNLKCAKISSNTEEDQYIGIALNDVSGGQLVNILNKGYCNGRRISTYNNSQPTTIQLNNITNNTTVTNKNVIYF